WAQPNTVVAFSTGSLVNLAQGKFGPHRPDAVASQRTASGRWGPNFPCARLTSEPVEKATTVLG
ncbi:MAG: hypothetical protein EOP93_12270, partial [Lysobacteraceae bacterium]